jgi:purine-binding chemotaxis protein CheW
MAELSRAIHSAETDKSSVAVADLNPELFLICRIGTTPCALPLAGVVETLRPLPTDALSGAPAFVAGLAIIRGAPVPVISGRYLLAGSSGSMGRWVVLRAGAHRVALGVDEVVGIEPLPGSDISAMPPLMRRSSAIIADMAALDGELLLVLDATRVIPDELFELLQTRRVA